MPNPLDNVTCGNGYTEAATIGPIWNSPGGYFTVDSGTVFAQLGYSQKGVQQLVWDDETRVPTGVGTLYAGTVAVRFRNYTAGTNGVVSGRLAYPGRPVLSVGAGGIATPVNAGTITGIVNSDGTIAAGTGFSVNHSGTGTYVISFTNAFLSAPTVIANALDMNLVFCAVNPRATTSGCTIAVQSSGGFTNSAFNFLAQVP